MNEVHPGLWIGNAGEARDPNVLASAGIQAVVDIAANEQPARLPQQWIYCRVPLNDGGGNGDASLKAAIRVLATLVRNEIPTLIACSFGMSRAPTVTAFAIAEVTGQAPSDVIRRIADQRQLDVSPSLWKHVESLTPREEAEKPGK